MCIFLSLKPVVWTCYLYGGMVCTLQAHEVIPMLETTYRADPFRRALFGHSLSGLFGVWELQHMVCGYLTMIRYTVYYDQQLAP